jgi:6-phosphogluconolactonase
MSIHRHIYKDPVETAKACARHTLALLQEALAGDGEATMAVSGGSTPRLMFAELARESIDWDRVHLFWVDERAVPPADPESNYRMAEEAFIVPAHFPRRNVHRIAGELPPDVAAQRYSDELRSFFSLRDGEMPHFDIIHQGMGPDCHTASLFPGEPLIEDREHLAAAVYVEKLKRWRITLLPGALLNARHTVILVCGADKAEAMQEAFEGPYDLLKCPAQLIAHGARSVTWFLDEAAAAQVK